MQNRQPFYTLPPIIKDHEPAELRKENAELKKEIEELRKLQALDASKILSQEVIIKKHEEKESETKHFFALYHQQTAEWLEFIHQQKEKDMYYQHQIDNHFPRFREEVKNFHETLAKVEKDKERFQVSLQQITIKHELLAAENKKLKKKLSVISNEIALLQDGLVIIDCEREKATRHVSNIEKHMKALKNQNKELRKKLAAFESKQQSAATHPTLFGISMCPSTAAEPMLVETEGNNNFFNNP